MTIWTPAARRSRAAYWMAVGSHPRADGADRRGARATCRAARGRDGTDDDPRGRARLRRIARGRARHPRRLRVAPTSLEARRNESRRTGEWDIHARPDQTDEARATAPPAAALLALGPMVSDRPYHAAFLAMAKRNGGSKISAICALARRMVPMLLHIVQTGEAFDRTRWDRARVDPALQGDQAA